MISRPRYTVEALETHWATGATLTQSFPHHCLVYRLFPSRRGLALTLRFDSETAAGPLGQLSFIPASAELETHPEPAGHTKAIIYRFDPDWLPWAQLPSDWYRRDLHACLGVHNRRLHILLQQLGAELLHPGFGSDALIECLAEAAVISLHRFLDPRASGRKPLIVGGKLSNSQLTLITDYINSCTGPGPTVCHVAAEIGFSVRHLSRAFRDTTGESLIGFLAQARTTRAMSAILSSDGSLDQIAQQLGFSEASAFSNAFLKATGHRPGTFRKLFSR